MLPVLSSSFWVCCLAHKHIWSQVWPLAQWLLPEHRWQYQFNEIQAHHNLGPQSCFSWGLDKCLVVRVSKSIRAMVYILALKIQLRRLPDSSQELGVEAKSHEMVAGTAWVTTAGGKRLPCAGLQKLNSLTAFLNTLFNRCPTTAQALPNRSLPAEEQYNRARLNSHYKARHSKLYRVPRLTPAALTFPSSEPLHLGRLPTR